MDENLMSRAIFAGVSIFVTLAIISGVITYYTIARNMANSISTNNNIGSKYTKTIEAYLQKDVLTGYEVKNLLNYFLNDGRVNINIDKMHYVKPDGNIESLMNDERLININMNEEKYTEIGYMLIPNEQFKLIVNKENTPEIYKLNAIE